MGKRLESWVSERDFDPRPVALMTSWIDEGWFLRAEEREVKEGDLSNSTGFESD